MSHEPNNLNNSPLLDLPTELSLRIYEFDFSDVETCYVAVTQASNTKHKPITKVYCSWQRTHVKRNPYSPEYFRARKSSVEMLRCCRTVRREATDLMFQQSHLSLNVVESHHSRYEAG